MGIRTNGMIACISQTHESTCLVTTLTKWIDFVRILFIRTCLVLSTYNISYLMTSIIFLLPNQSYHHIIINFSFFIKYSHYISFIISCDIYLLYYEVRMLMLQFISGRLISFWNLFIYENNGHWGAHVLHTFLFQELDY